jgi:hypothetical protein
MAVKNNQNLPIEVDKQLPIPLYVFLWYIDFLSRIDSEIL